MVLRQVNNDKPKPRKKPRKQPKNKSTQILNHKCPTCKSLFRSAKTLEDHCKSHVSVNPFECDYCKRRFAEEETMKRHLQKEHISGMEFK